jgi:hypothetical protein
MKRSPISRRPRFPAIFLSGGGGIRTRDLRGVKAGRELTPWRRLRIDPPVGFAPGRGVGQVRVVAPAFCGASRRRAERNAGGHRAVQTAPKPGGHRGGMRVRGPRDRPGPAARRRSNLLSAPGNGICVHARTVGLPRKRARSRPPLARWRGHGRCVTSSVAAR